MNKFILLSFILFTSFVNYAQKGSIEGKVSSKNGGFLAYANISIANTNYKTFSNASGEYTIENIPLGKYTIVIKFIGYKSEKTQVVVEANKTTTVPQFLLIENQETLKEVVLNGHINNKHVVKESPVVSKMPLEDIENPQVYNTVSKTILEEQIVTNFDDALKNVPGIDKLWESTGRGGDGAGYFSLRGFAVQPTMVNGLPALTNGSPDPANIENIEVIKGPSGTLFGSSLISYGGLINVNTKKPYFNKGGAISYTAGTYGLNRVTADYNTTVNDENTAAVRINTAYHTQNSYQDAGFKKSFFFAPSFTYKANDKLTFNVNTEFYNGKSTNQTMLFLDRGAELRVNNIDELNYDHSKSYTSNDLYMETPTYSLQGQINYQINNNWTSQTVVSRSNAKSEGYYSYLYEITQYTPVTDGIVLGRYMSKQNSETIGTDIQQNFIGDFKIANVRNRVVVGLDYFNKEVINNSSGYVGNGNIYIGNDLAFYNQNVLGITDEASYVDDSGVLTQAGTDALLATSAISKTKSKQEVYSVYASDVVNILPELSAMASLRVDRFSNDDYDQVALSPKFGLIYQPILNKISLFANYMDGFSNLAPVEILTDGVSSNKSLTPEHANQFEFGTKLNLFNNKLSATFSYYDINVKDKSLRIDVDASNYYYSQDGEQNSKGFEASITANPVKGLNILAGYSYNDSELVKGSADFVGLRPESAGSQNLANLWISYKFYQGTLNNFGLGFGGNYAGDNLIMNRNLAGTFTIPEYIILNSSVFYDVKDFRIGLKLDNITNELYYKGWSTISPQNTRTFSANFSYKF